MYLILKSSYKARKLGATKNDICLLHGPCMACASIVYPTITNQNCKKLNSPHLK